MSSSALDMSTSEIIEVLMKKIDVELNSAGWNTKGAFAKLDTRSPKDAVDLLYKIQLDEPKSSSFEENELQRQSLLEIKSEAARNSLNPDDPLPQQIIWDGFMKAQYKILKINRFTFHPFIATSHFCRIQWKGSNTPAG